MEAFWNYRTPQFGFLSELRRLLFWFASLFHWHLLWSLPHFRLVTPFTIIFIIILSGLCFFVISYCLFEFIRHSMFYFTSTMSTESHMYSLGVKLAFITSCSGLIQHNHFVRHLPTWSKYNWLASGFSSWNKSLGYRKPLYTSGVKKKRVKTME